VMHSVVLGQHTLMITLWHTPVRHHMRMSMRLLPTSAQLGVGVRIVLRYVPHGCTLVVHHGEGGIELVHALGRLEVLLMLMVLRHLTSVLRLLCCPSTTKGHSQLPLVMVVLRSMVVVAANHGHNTWPWPHHP